MVWSAAYKPFGEAQVDQGSTVVNNFRFPGQYYDQESGLHYNWHRYYDPKTGRYLTADPIGQLIEYQKLNHLYNYAENNPVALFDLFGLWIYAKGITGDGLTKEILSHESAVDNVFMTVACRLVIVTSTTEGKHLPNSLHYSGNAIDLRTRDLSTDQINKAKNMLEEALGSNYDIIYHDNHFHIEYDPPIPNPSSKTQENEPAMNN